MPPCAHPWLRADAAPFPRPTEPPAGARIVVLAPHPDDEVLGCGGTLALARRLSGETRVSVYYLTDGEQGTGDPRETGEPLRLRRRGEARAGLAALGLSGAEHAGFPDGFLQAGTDEVDRVRSFLWSLSPDLVFVPSPFDPHPDHRAAALIAALALEEVTPLDPLERMLDPGQIPHARRETGSACATPDKYNGGAPPGPTVWIYEVTPSLPISAIVRIDEAIEEKARALAAHASQNAGDRLVRAGTGLAAARALYGPAGWRHAEGFRIGSARIYREFCAAVGWPVP